VVLLALGAAVFIAFAVASVLVLPDRLVKRDTSGKELTTAEQLASAKNAVRTTLIQAVVGLAALTGIAVAWGQLKADQRQLQIERRHLQAQLNLNRQGQVADRFTRAVGQLGSGNFDVQLGGVYALERIADEADPNTRRAVFEVLTAYVRRHSERQDPECPPEEPNDTSKSCQTVL
jgi:tellurite resistance protein